MQAKLETPDEISIFELTLVAIVLFYGGVVFCLPVQVMEGISYPWWATRISVGNITLHEIAFFVWICLYGFRFILIRLLKGGIPTRQAAIFLIILSIWCGLISLYAPLPFKDLGRSLRLLLIAIMLISTVRWTRQTGDFPMFMLLTGFCTGTVINLVMSFQYPYIVHGTMRLAGQNTPGVGMAIAIHLAAWLFFHSRNRSLHFFSIITASISSFGCALSFSRIGWIVGVFGLLAWFYILFLARPSSRIERIRIRHIRRVWIPLISLTLMLAVSLPVMQNNFALIRSLFEQKEWVGNDSNKYRKNYFIGTAEIIFKHPFGVGYSGFYDAMTATEIYRSGRAAEEESLEANPHSGFLYYISAGGFVGGALSVALFVLLLNSMRLGLVFAFGPQGRILFTLLGASYIMIGLTVPYIYNSIIIIVPTAIAAGWGWSHRVGQLKCAPAKMY